MNEALVTVAWITPTVQEIVPVTVSAGSTVAAAVDASRIVEHYSLDIHALRVGINGRLVTAGTVVNDGDRVELYRPLIADAKAVRRAAAVAKSRTSKTAEAKKQKI